MIKRLLLCFLIIQLILPNSLLALDNNVVFNTKWVVESEIVTDNGFLVSYERIDQCIKNTMELKITKLNYENDKAYCDNSLALQKEKFELDVKKILEQDKYVIDGLKKELSEKSVWYKQPFWVASGTAVSIILLSAGIKGR